MRTRTGTITLTALAAAAEADYTITETNRGTVAQVGQVVVVNTLATPETGLSIAHAYVSAPGVITVRVANLNAAAALTAGDISVRYCVLS